MTLSLSGSISFNAFQPYLLSSEHKLFPLTLALVSFIWIGRLLPSPWNFALALSYIRSQFKCYLLREAFINLPCQQYPSTSIYLVIFHNWTLLYSIISSFQYQKTCRSLSQMLPSGEHKLYENEISSIYLPYVPKTSVFINIKLVNSCKLLRMDLVYYKCPSAAIIVIVAVTISSNNSEECLGICTDSVK